MSGIDYTTVATITIFTSFFVGIGQELAKLVIGYVKKWHSRVKTIKVK